MFICDCGEIFSAPEYHKGEDHCPGCGSKYFDEAVQCKICGEYVSNDDAYGYGHDLVCKDCIKSRKNDIDFLAGATDSDATDFIDDYANDIAEAYIIEEGK